MFRPYSGVKTSILILDRALAKKSNRIAFFKVENDGFDLGDQRREITKNDLPRVKAEIAEYLGRLRVGEPVDGFEPAPTDQVAEPEADYTATLGLIADKAKIAEGGEYNLSGERYRESHTDNTKYEWAELGDIILGKPEYGSGARKVPYDNKVRYVRITDITGNSELKSDDLVSPSVIEPHLFLKSNDLLIARSGSVGRTYIHEDLPGIYQYAGYLIRFRINPVQAIPKYVYFVTKSNSWCEWILSNAKTGTLTNINAKQYSAFRFPLPPLEVQQQIVAEIEGYQRVIDGARAVIDNYRPQIVIDPEWSMVEVGEACIVNPRKSELVGLDGATIVSFVPMSDMGENSMYFDVKDEKNLQDVGPSYTYFRDDDVLIAKVTSCFENGKAGIAKDLSNGVGFGSSEFYVLRPTESVISQWIYLCVATPVFRKWATPQMTGTGGLQRVPRSVIENYKIPFPSPETQQAIIAEIEAEQALVAANRELIERFEKKIHLAVERVWGKSEAETARE